MHSQCPWRQSIITMTTSRKTAANKSVLTVVPGHQWFFLTMPWGHFSTLMCLFPFPLSLSVFFGRGKGHFGLPLRLLCASHVYTQQDLNCSCCCHSSRLSRAVHRWVRGSKPGSDFHWRLWQAPEVYGLIFMADTTAHFFTQAHTVRASLS